MSSIKKYVGGDKKEWVTFGETNIYPNYLSNANNISVDFGECESVNSLLYSQQKDIEELKRNVSWLALHGGGGSGGSGGAGGNIRKASCQITINDSSKEVSVSEGQTIYVRLSKFKGSSTTVPWNIKIAFEDQNIYAGAKTQGEYDTITVPISWSLVSRFFDGTGKFKNHLMTVQATYKDEDTQIEGSGTLGAYVYIPTITVKLTTKDQYNVDGLQSDLTASVIIDTALKGKFKLRVQSTTYNKFLDYDSFEFDKTTDSATFQINDFIDAFKEDDKPQPGVYSSTFLLYNENATTGSLQLVYQTTKQIIIFSNEVDLLVNFDGLSPDPEEDKRTKVYDNVKNMLFSFYAFKNGSTEYKYTILLKDQTDTTQPDIEVIKDRTASFQTTITINKIVDQFITDHNYEAVIKITPTNPDGDMKEFRGYIKCIQGQYAFITYSNDGELNRLFMLDTFNPILNNAGILPEVTITATSTDTSKEGDGHPISTNLSFAQINPRSGLIANDDNMKALRLYDTYVDIANDFRYTVKEEGLLKINSTNVQDQQQFTICLCYKTQSYTSNDHVVFALCNNGFINQGIAIKNDGVYVKGSKVLTVYGNKVVTIHIVYNNESGSTTQWGDKSCYKIYVNGVITYMSDACPFQEAGDNKIIQNSNLKISVNGYSNTESPNRQEQCNCNIYNIEIIKSVMNEIDILGSYINNKIRTTYKDFSPDFDILNTELNKNCCTYDAATHTITSDMYPTTGAERKFVFKGVLLDNSGEVPQTDDTDEKQRWISKLSSLSLPITYIDLKGSSSPDIEEWTFENFIAPGDQLKNTSVVSKFYYWDPKTNQMPISSDSVEVKTQGTSTQEDYIKNLEIKFSSFEDSGSGKIVQDLFFVKNDWIPENSYVLKADIVDSSHANNASIGKFINEQFFKDNSFGFGFDNKGIASKNITQTTEALKNAQEWNINPVLRHTVEGFQTLLLVRFAKGDFINLGIYSFNIGRNAARNLGFEYITGITDTDGAPVMNVVAPFILKNVIVNTSNEDQIFWVENSNSQNFDGISAWTSTTTTITPDDPAQQKTGTNPDYACRFWHCQQGTVEEDTKLNQLFETKYHNTIEDVYPARINTFNNFVKQISQLPVEGLLKTTALDQSFPQVTGGYATWKYTADGNWEILPAPHMLKEEDLEPSDVNTFDPSQIASYYVIALMFGLVDNLDKNISFRIFGDAKILADFYDMDTALGLNNAGLEDVSPTVGIKLVTNYRNTLDQDYPQETFNQEEVKDKYKRYDKFLPETYSNKLWLSLDSNSMRTFNGINCSLYSSLWFKLRQYLDNIAKSEGYKSTVDFFVDRYFGNQVNCGTFIYNYDYTMKYLNDYEQTGQKQSKNTISKLHGRRIDEVREWLKNHIDFLDSYFYWRGKYKFINGSKVVPSGLETVVAKKVSITSSSNNNSIEIETEHPVVVHSSSTADGDEVGDTLTVDDVPQNIKVSGGGTDKAMALNCSSLLKNFNLIALGAKKFRAQNGSKITFLEELILDGLTIIADGISMDDFVNDSDQDANVLTKISMNRTKFAQSFDLNLNKFQFLNVSYVDIKDSTNIHGLSFYRSDDTTTQNLKYLNVEGSQIENLTLKNQSYLVLPNVDTCNNLVTLTYENCNLDNTAGNRTAVSNYVDIDLSVQNSIQKVNLKNVEHIKSIRINKCPQFQELNLEGLSSLTSLTLESDLQLNKINVIDCPKLQTITITHCSAFSEIEILSAPSLSNLNLEYDVALTALKISEDSVSAISELNIRNVDISGFNFYNYNKKRYDNIIKDPLGHEVLDFSKFKSLDSNKIIIRRDATGDLTQDKCANFLAYRFPNTPGKCYYALDRNRDDVGIRFTNLKNVYGHIGIQAHTDFSSQTDLFLTSGDYKGYPPFLSKVIPNGSGGINSETLITSTVFDNIEKNCSTLAPKLRNTTNLSGISEYIKDGFLTCTNDKVEEFDTREWATNYTVTTLSYVFEGSRRLTQLPFQYLMYRYSMYERNAQVAGTVNNIHGFANYAPSNIVPGRHIRIPANTFKFIGNTISDMRRFFGWADNMPLSSHYVVDKELMQHFTKITTYGGIGSREIMFWDALSAQTQLTALGNVDNGPYYVANFTKSLSGTDDHGEQHDYGPAFLSTLTNLKKIMYFQPDLSNFHLSASNLPTSIEEVVNSFTKLNEDEIIDLSALFHGCNKMRNLYNSFNTAQLIVKPSTFKQMPSIQQISFTNANKILVEDRITLDNYLDSYDEDSGRYQIRDNYDPVPSLNTKIYTPDMFQTFIRNVLTANTELTSTNYLLANMTIPYKNIYENEYNALPLHTDLLKNNTKVQSLQNFFKGQNFRYSLVSEMFSTLSAVTNMYAAFANTPSLSCGIDSCIPYKFLYTGQPSTKTKSVQFTGTDRFDDPPASYPDFIASMKNSYVPPRATDGSTSYGWDDLSTSLRSSGLLNGEAFADVKQAYHLTGDSYVDLPNDLNNYKDVCPLVTCKIIDDMPTYEITPGGEPLVRTLSTIHSSMSSDVNEWKQHVCGIQSKIHSYPVYNRTIANINYLFSGNACLKPYDGSIVTEENAEYNPYKLNYNDKRQMLSVNVDRNTFLSDDQWSNNGAIWKWSDDVVDWVIDDNNYITSHFNSSTPDMRVLSSNEEQVTDLSNTGADIIYYRVDSYKTALMYNDDKSKLEDLVEYMLLTDQVQEFRYICPPDMFRYLNADIQVLSYIFAGCDNFCNSKSVNYHTDKKLLNVGLTGRIPPNLFKPVKNLKDITGIFKQCYHITGYESLNDAGERCSYLIPADLFAQAQTVNCFNEAFYGTPIKYSPDFSTPLNKIIAGSSFNGIKLSIRSMFARCIWCNVKTTISKLFNGKYFKDIDYAFLNTLGTMKSSDQNFQKRIIDNGAVITDGSTPAVLPHLEVFAVATKYVPAKVTQTYYGSIHENERKSIYTIGSTDIVRNTQSSYVAVTPTV